MLTRQQIEDIIADNDQFSEFVSATMVLALTKGLERTKLENTPLNAISNFIEVLRKARADLTGDSHELKVPHMMVNIQFGSAPKAQSIPIEGEIVEKRAPEPASEPDPEPKTELVEHSQDDFSDLFAASTTSEWVPKDSFEVDHSDIFPVNTDE